MKEIRILEEIAAREAGDESRDWPWYRAAVRVDDPLEYDRRERLSGTNQAIRSLVRRYGYDRATGKVVIETDDFRRKTTVIIGYRIAPAIHDRLQDATRLERDVDRLERERGSLVRGLSLWAPVLALLLVLAGVVVGRLAG